MPIDLIKPAIIESFLAKKETLRLLSIEQRSLFYRALFTQKNQSIVVVCESLYQAQLLYEHIKQSQEACYIYAIEEALQITVLSQSRELLFKRLQTIEQLHKRPIIVITHGLALTRPISQFERLLNAKITLKENQIIEPMDLKMQLVNAGYQRVDRVTNPFEYAYRGAIIDVMTTESNHPYRIEFFDNQIESIRIFSPQTQHSIDKVEQIDIFSATEHLLLTSQCDQAQAKLMPYYMKTSAICDDEEALQHHFQMELESIQSHHYFDELAKYYQVLDPLATTFIEQVEGLVIIEDLEQLTFEIERYQVENDQLLLELAKVGQAIAYLPLQFDLQTKLEQLNYYPIYVKQAIYPAQTLPIESYERVLINLKHLKKDIESLLFKGFQVIICEPDQQNQDFLHAYLKDEGLQAPIMKGLETTLKLSITKLLLTQSLINVETKQAYLKVAIHNQTKLKKPKKQYEFAKDITHIEQLSKGDYVVHEQYGIGKYMGLITLEVQNSKRDFLHIAYRNDDILYVPLENFKYVKKFVAKDGYTPKVNALNSGEWEKTKRRVKERLEQIVDELLEVQAARKKEIGFAFEKDNGLQAEFEASFMYDLTPDQVQAVKDVKKDMESSYPMDRLICGDVGFGKTEVAIRAIFKAVMSNKQVAFLCPTTILTRQHTHTIQERFKDYPIVVESVSRFKSDKEVKAILAKLKLGHIDVIVGTHRLLSKDIVFKDLGLLVIDEEQRFGVVHKERMKHLKLNVDVLTLSATPIPRTLQMSLMELKSLSLLEIAPKNRLPIQTYVVQKSQALIKAAIEKELARKGKVFFLHNDTEKIYGIASQIQDLIPQAKVVVIHGKMRASEIEKVISGFLADEYNVLVCTTIIETGLDIEGADTILIDNADRFGLSQLYQIKGRVGRRDRIAYAYLMMAPKKELTKQAALRLQAIQEFTRLGSSYQIAMRDLAIRGAGDVLGAKQAGFIDNVGIDLYLKLLQEVKDERNQIEVKPSPNHYALPIDMYIPKSIEITQAEKLEIYQRLEATDSFEDLATYVHSFTDVYGRMPKSVEQLIIKKQFDLYCHAFSIENVLEIENQTVLVFSEKVSNQLDGQKLFSLLNESKLSAKLTYQTKHIRLLVKHDTKWVENLVDYLAKVKKQAVIGVI